mgnify:CR=1 FL=1
MEDREIIRLLTAGKPEGLDGLMVRHGPMLRYIVRGILTDPREQEECLNDITLLIWHKIGSYDPEKGSLAAWLTALARNRALNCLRDGERHRGTEELSPAMADPAPGPEELLLRKERARAIREAVNGLGEVDRSLFYRKYYYLQSTAQMAAELGLTERRVEGRLRRLRLKLRKVLGGEWNG